MDKFGALRRTKYFFQLYGPGLVVAAHVRYISQLCPIGSWSTTWVGRPLNHGMPSHGKQGPVPAKGSDAPVHNCWPSECHRGRHLNHFPAPSALGHGLLFQALTLEQSTTVGGAPPPPDQRDHCGKKRNLQEGKSDRAIFLVHKLLPPPPPPFLLSSNVSLPAPDPHE